MKYKITNTDLQLDNKLHPENSEVELTKEQTKGIEVYLIPITQAGLSGKASLSGIVITETEAKTDHPELVSGSTTVSKSSTKKSKRKTKGIKK